MNPITFLRFRSTDQTIPLWAALKLLRAAEYLSAIKEPL